MAQTYSTRTGGPQTRLLVYRDLGVIRWGPVWGGAMIASALFALFATFWIAIAYGNGGSDYFRSNIQWWIALSAIAAYFLGGALAGSLSTRTGPGTGVATSTAVWALGTIGGLVAPISLGLRPAGSSSLSGTLASLSGEAMWITFATVAIGLIASVLGGMSATGWQLADPTEDQRVGTAPAQRNQPSDTYGDANYPAAQHSRH
jgi:hypothetical protein